MTQETQKKTGILCSILRNKDLLGGTLREFEKVILLVGGPFEPTEDAPGVKLIKRQIYGHQYLHVEPIDEPTQGQIGYMAGGTFIFTSDGRFPNDYPLPLHDYTETPK
jgi:hypothetical protein